MKKDFTGWNQRKIVIQDLNQEPIHFSEREVWWCSLGQNIGDEEDGKNELFERPVLILRKFNKNIAIVIPLTTHGKNDSMFYYKLSFELGSWLILSQIRLVSSKRLLRKMYRLGRGEFASIKDIVKQVIFPKNSS